MNSDVPRHKYAGKSLNEVFHDIAESLHIDMTRLNRSCCYMLEMVHPEHRIVVRYDETQLYHVATRDMNTLMELVVDDEESRSIGFQRPRRYDVEMDFTSLKDVMKSAQSISWNQGEGFVVCDENFNRVKIKSRSYIRVSFVITITITITADHTSL